MSGVGFSTAGSLSVTGGFGGDEKLLEPDRPPLPGVLVELGMLVELGVVVLLLVVLLPGELLLGVPVLLALSGVVDGRFTCTVASSARGVNGFGPFATVMFSGEKSVIRLLPTSTNPADRANTAGTETEPSWPMRQVRRRGPDRPAGAAAR